MTPIRGGVSVVLAVVLAVAAQAQSFDVVSVKSQEGRRGAAIRSAVRFYEPGITLHRLVQFAYDLPSYRVTGGPEWISKNLWEVDARTSEPTDVDQMRLRMRDLLRERFALAVRFETRELPIYELRTARPDGQLGSSMVSAVAQCVPLNDLATASELSTEVTPCLERFVLGSTITTTFRRFSAADIAEHIGNSALLAHVVDRTGLAGTWDARLMYSTDGLPIASLVPFAKQPDAPALLTAIQEQLGLKLERSNGPVDVLVVASVDLPTPN